MLRIVVLGLLKACHCIGVLELQGLGSKVILDSHLPTEIALNASLLQYILDNMMTRTEVAAAFQGVKRACVTGGDLSGLQTYSGGAWGTCGVDAFRSCGEILKNDPTLTNVDGMYTIDPDGATGPTAPFRVYCDMTTLGGGWTLVAKATGTAGATTLDAHDTNSWVNAALSGTTANLNVENALGPGYATVAMNEVLIRSISNPSKYLAFTVPGASMTLHSEVSKMTMRVDGALLGGGPGNLDFTAGCEGSGGASADNLGWDFGFNLPDTDAGAAYAANTHLGVTVSRFSSVVVGWRGRNGCGQNSGGGFGWAIFTGWVGLITNLGRHICGFGGNCNAGDAVTATFKPHGLFVRSPAPTNFVSCKQILAALPASVSGTYIIDPDGAGPYAPFRVYCDMETNGGGWTLVAKGTGAANNNELDGNDVGRWLRGNYGDTTNLNIENALGLGYQTVKFNDILMRSIANPTKNFAFSLSGADMTLFSEVSKKTQRQDGTLFAGSANNLEYGSGCTPADGTYYYGINMLDTDTGATYASNTYLGQTVGHFSSAVVGWRGQGTCTGSTCGGFGFHKFDPWVGYVGNIGRHICGYGSNCNSGDASTQVLKPHALFVR